jgi:hypothetical protein
MMWKPQQAGRYSSGLKKMLFLYPFLLAWFRSALYQDRVQAFSRDA